MRKVFFYHATSNLHAVYRLMKEHPPEGYQFTLPPETKTKKLIAFSQRSPFLKQLYRKTLKNFLYGTSTYNTLVSSTIPSDTDLVFAFGTPIREEFPYVLDLIDSPFSLRGHNYSKFIQDLEKINEVLEKPSCKAIIVPFSDCEHLCKSYFTQKVAKKLHLVNYAVKEQSFPPRVYGKKINFLFLGSLANPDDFEIKGGPETIAAFALLSQKYGSQVSLTIRARVPAYAQASCNHKGVTLLTKDLTERELEKLFIESHVFLTPAHFFIAMAPLQALSFGLPLVGLDTYGTNEYISDKKNGFLISPREHLPYTDPSYMTKLRTKKYTDLLQTPDTKVVSDLSRTMALFVENPLLSKKMGFVSHKMAQDKFSIAKRNEQLKKIFDSAFKEDK